MAIHDSYYTNTFRDTVGFHGLSEASQQVEFVLRVTGITKRQYILDLGCGFGRHSLALAEMGYRVTGLDQSADYLGEARLAGQLRDRYLNFVQQDMREMNYIGAFDAVLSMATSLAFYDEATNRDLFARIGKALRPGGVFFFDQSNMFWWMKRTMPERYRFDAATCVLSGRHVKDTPDGPIESGWDLRLYHLAELKSFLSVLGLRLAKSFGGFDGSDFTADSQRLITVWRKE